MSLEERDRPAADAEPVEGVTLLALRPIRWDWGEEVTPPGVVLEHQELDLTSGAWGYLAPRLEPLPPDWPQESPDGGPLTIKRLVLAAGMSPPSRFDASGWLLLSRREEVVTIAALLFNSHGVHFLNHARHWRYAHRWPERLDQLRGFLERHELSSSRLLIDAGLVLELYGIRPARDIDFLCLDAVETPEAPFRDGDAQLVHHGVDKRALVEDVRYHFEVDGVRFVAFDQLKRLKRRRQRLEDLNDLAMMRALEDGREWRLVVGRWLGLGLEAMSFLRRLMRHRGR